MSRGRVGDPGVPRPTLLAVVGDEGDYRGVVDRARTLADHVDARLHAAVLHERLGATTDPVLAAYVDRRLDHRLRLLDEELTSSRRAAREVSVTVLEHERPALPYRGLTAWRAVDAHASLVGASLIVLPWELSEMAWSRVQEGGRLLVAVPADRPTDRHPASVR